MLTSYAHPPPPCPHIMSKVTTSGRANCSGATPCRCKQTAVQLACVRKPFKGRLPAFNKLMYLNLCSEWPEKSRNACAKQRTASFLSLVVDVCLKRYSRWGTARNGTAWLLIDKPCLACVQLTHGIRAVVYGRVLTALLHSLIRE